MRFGAGPRGSQALVLAAKARAALAGEAAADVDDVRAVVTPVMRHRLVLSYRAEAEGCVTWTCCARCSRTSRSGLRLLCMFTPSLLFGRLA